MLRTVSKAAAEDYLFVERSGVLDRLIAEGALVGTRRIDHPLSRETGAALVLEHPALPFISYPYEWSFPLLKAAALHHLRIQASCLENGVSFSDSSAYNVQFVGTRPILIDVLSLRRYRANEIWIGYKQFCEQFLFPLLLRAYRGIAHNAWYRGAPEGIEAAALARLLPWYRHLQPGVLMHVDLPARLGHMAEREVRRRAATGLGQGRLPRARYLAMLNHLHAWIAGLRPSAIGREAWRTYAETNTYEERARAEKQAFVGEFVGRTRPAMVWDLGCNTGAYAEAALAAGAGLVIGFDGDHGALERAFALAQSKRLDFLPLYQDLADPSPGLGWRQGERAGLAERATADAVLALALVHHLVFARNVPLAEAIDWVVSLAPSGIIEFVPKDDPTVRLLLATREDIFTDYGFDAFRAAVQARARLVREARLAGSGRVLIQYERPRTSSGG